MASKINEVTGKLQKTRISSTEDKAIEEYLPLKMVQDKKTEMYVKFAKVMVVFQGCYTKSREREKTSEMIATKFKYTSCIVSDKRFSKESKTPCSYENAEEFYAYFKCTSKWALQDGNNLLVIDSTMSNIEQNKYYVALAYKMQYVVLVVPPVVMKTSGYFWPEGSLAASFRNDAKTVIQPTNMFQHLFCAWYLHDVDSQLLRHDAGLYIQDCLEEIPEFKKLMDKNCVKVSPDGEELSLIDAIRQYFNLTDKRQDLAFCATKILGNSMRLMNEYFKKPSVQGNYGKMSKLFIAGYIISPHMIAAMVKLTHAQKELWEMKEEMDESFVENSDIKPTGPWKLFEDSKKELPDVDVQLISSKSNQTLVNTGQTFHEPLKNINHFAKGRACHIILGKAAGASPHHVDFGVQFALHREHATVKSKDKLPEYDLERCIVKRNGKYWFIYLKEYMSINALFASCVKPYPFDYAIAC